MTSTEAAGKIYVAIPAMICDCEAIAKDQRNQQQGFNYRSIDQVYNAVHPLLAKYKVFPTSEILEDTTSERISKTGGTLFHTRLKVRYWFNADDGSRVASEAIGEGMDSGDKSANKAQSIAYKYALFQLLCIPTATIDPDATTPDIAPRDGNAASGNTIEDSRPRSTRPPCPKCGSTTAVFASKAPETGFYCWKKKDGCGHTWQEGDLDLPPSDSLGHAITYVNKQDDPAKLRIAYARAVANTEFTTAQRGKLICAIWDRWKLMFGDNVELLEELSQIVGASPASEKTKGEYLGHIAKLIGKAMAVRDMGDALVGLIEGTQPPTEAA